MQAPSAGSNASDVVKWAENQGWSQTQTPTGPIKFVDENGVVRVTIKKGSPRTPGSETPHIELRDAAGQRGIRYVAEVPRTIHQSSGT
jgi:hypothetical protein